MQATLLIISILITWPSISVAAGFDDSIRQISPTIRPSACQVYWYFPQGNQLVENQILAFSGLCNIFSDRGLLGVAILDSPDLLNLLAGKNVIGLVDTNHVFDPSSEGLIIYSPADDDILFQSAAAMPMEVVLQVLDRNFNTNHSSPAGLEQALRSIVKESYGACLEMKVSANGDPVDLCDVMRKHSRLLILPPGCTECSLKEYRNEIIRLAEEAHYEARPFYIASFDEFNPAESLDIIEPEFILSFAASNHPRIALLRSVSSSSRLPPYVVVLHADEELSISKLERLR